MFKTRILPEIRTTLAIAFLMLLPTKKALSVDITISTSVTAAQTFNANNQKLTVANGGNLTVTGANDVSGTANTGLQVEVDSGNAANGISSTSNNSAISISGVATLSSVDLLSGTISSARSPGGTISITSTAVGSSTTINSNLNTTIANTATSGFAIDATSTANRTLTINNGGTISTNNNASSVGINLNDSNGGSIYNITNTGTINAGALGRSISIATSTTANTATITNNGGSITGAVSLSNLANTTLTNTSSGSITGNITATNGDLDITNTSGIITGNITLGSNAGTTLAINGGSVAGNVTLGNAAQVLTFGGGSLAGTINGAGQVAVNSNTALNGNIGATTSITSLSVTAGNALDAAINNNTIRATTLSLNSNSSFSLGTGAVTGTIQGATDGVGAVEFKNSNTLAGVVGTAANSLASVTIDNGKTVTATTRNIDATNVIISDNATLNKTTGTVTGSVTLGENATLTTTTGAITGTVNGNSASNGTINYNGTQTIATGSSIGQTNSLAAVNIANAVTITANDSIAADNINVGTGTSGVLTMNTAGKSLTGNVNIGNGGTLNISATTLAVNGDIKGSTDDDGIVNINQNFTSNGNLGTSSNSLTTLTIATGRTLNTAINNNDIDATTITLSGAASTLTLGAGDVTGNINFNNASSVLNAGSGAINGNLNATGGASRGIVNFTEDSTLNGNIGNTLSLATLNISSAKTLDAATNNKTIAATTISLGTDSSLNLGTGTVTGTIRGATDGVGAVNINDNNTLAGNIGISTNSLANINVADGKTVTATTRNLDATNITVGNGATLAMTTGAIIGATMLHNGATLSTNTGAITGTINGSSTAEGILNLNSTRTIAAGNSIGLTNSLNSINIANATTITVSESIAASTINVGTGTSGAISLSASKSITGDVNLANGATLTINGTGTAINGDVKGTSDDDGTVTVSQNFTTNGNLGTESNSLTTLSVAASRTLDLATNNNSIDSTNVTVGSGSIINVGNGNITGSVRGATDNIGTINFNGDSTINGTFGTSAQTILAMNVATGKTVDGTSTAMDVTTVALNSNATFKIGGSLAGLVRGVTDGVGNLVISNNFTSGGNFGSATNSLASLAVDDGKSLTMNGANLIDASSVSLGVGSSLTMGTGTITGNISLNDSSTLSITTNTITGTINGSSAGFGNLNLNGNRTIAAGLGIGQTSSLDSVNIADGVTITANESIAADNINVGTGTSGVLTVSTTGKALSGNVNIGNGGTLNVSATSIAVNGDIKGSTDDDGVVNLNQDFTSNGNLGTSTNSLTTITVAAGRTLNTATNNNDIDATTVNLAGASSTLTAGTGNITSNITFSNASATATIASTNITGNLNGSSNSQGIVNFNGSSTFNGAIGNSFSLSSVTIASGKSLDAATHNSTINATSLSLASNSTLSTGSGAVTSNATLASGAKLNLGSGTLTGTIQGSSDGVGIVDFTDNNTLGGNVGGSSNSLQTVSISNGKSVTANTNNIDATNINIENNADLTMTSGSLTGAVNLGSNSVVNLGSGSVTGEIKGSSDNNGTVNINSSRTLAANLGSNSNSLAAITIANSTTLSAGNFSLDAQKISLGSSSVLNLGSGTIKAEIDGSSAGNGTVNINSTNSFDLGFGSTASLNTINIANGANVTANESITANTLNVGGGSSGSLTLANNKTITGNINLGSSSSLTLNGNNTIGTINGSSSATGTLNISASTTYTTTGNIGTTNSLAQINVGSNANMNLGHDVHTSSLVNNGTMTFGNNARTIDGSVSGNGSSKFDFGSGSHIVTSAFTTTSGDLLKVTISSATNSGNLTVDGVANIASGTKLDVVINNASYVSNSKNYTVISGGSGSSISAISNSNLLINGVSTNRYSSLVFTTKQNGDNLVLNAERLLSPNFITNHNKQNVYDTINTIGNSASGDLKSLQQYLDSPNYSDTQKSQALNSVVPQNENAIGVNAINTVRISTNVINDRLQSLQLGAAAGDEPSSTGIWGKAFGNNANQKSFSSYEGYNLKTAGFAFGGDTELDNSTYVGVSTSIANSTVKSNSNDKKLDLDSYQVSAYGGKSFGKSFINAVVGVTQNVYTSNRQISSVGKVAKAKYDGQTYITRVDSGISYSSNNGFVLTPTLSSLFSYNTVSSYTEDRAGTLNLNVKSYRTRFFEGRIGSILSYNQITSNGFKVSPKIKASIGYDFIGDRQRMESNFVGQSTSFRTEGSNTEKRSIIVGGGVNVYSSNSVNFDVDYTYESKRRYQGKSVVVSFRYDF